MNQCLPDGGYKRISSGVTIVQGVVGGWLGSQY